MGSNLNIDSSRRKPAPYWAKKIGRALNELFAPESLDPRHPVAVVKDSNSLTLTSADSHPAAMPNMWRVHQTRKAVFQDIERMDNEDETVATALDIIADCSVAYAVTDNTPQFSIKSDNKEVQDILNRMSARLDLPNDIWQIARDAVKHGNELRETIIDRSKMQIIALKQTVSYQIYPKTTERGDKLPGWLVFKDSDLYANQKGQELEEWQICPFQFGPMRGSLSVPPLASARRNWIRLSKMEDGMAIARLVRAYDKVVHKIPVRQDMPQDEIMKRIRMYKDSISKKRMLDSEGALSQLDSPLDVDSDYFLPTTGNDGAGVDLLSANNAQLGNLADIMYHREKLLTRLQVPIAYLQISSAQKTHLTAGASKQGNVELQFARMLRRVQRMLIKGVKRICDIELLLNGIAPTEDLYHVAMTNLNTRDLKEDAEIELSYAQAAVYFVEAMGVLPPEFIAEKFMHLTDEQQDMLTKFLDANSTKIVDAKIKTLQLGAVAKPAFGQDPTKDRLPGDNTPGKGSGNQNKAKAARTTETKGAATTKQGVPLELMVDTMFDLQEELYQDLREHGLAVPAIDELSQKTAIRANLLAIPEVNFE